MRRPLRSAILHGYYGRKNAGDDAFLIVSAWAARKWLGCDRVWAHADSLPQTYGLPIRRMFMSWQMRGATRLNPLLEAWRTRGADSILFGGGSIFHSTDLCKSYARALDRAGKGPHVAAGVSIGPFRDAGAEAACGRVLERLAFVGVRDRQSLERGRKAAPKARVELTFDLAPLLFEATGAAVETGERRGLGVALCGFARPEDRVGEPARVEAVARALGGADEVVLIDLNAEPDTDARVHEALREKVRVPVRHLRYAEDPLAVARAIAGVRGLIAMRLHAAVFAFLVRTPTLLLGYHEKCAAWAEMIGLDRSMIFDASAIDADALARAVTRLPESPAPTLDPAEAIARARGNFSWNGK
jgi:polysaccharide pyruvyl transferase WcaK-like protein